jgi:hypothetical protein
MFADARRNSPAPSPSMSRGLDTSKAVQSPMWVFDLHRMAPTRRELYHIIRTVGLTRFSDPTTRQGRITFLARSDAFTKVRISMSRSRRPTPPFHDSNRLDARTHTAQGTTHRPGARAAGSQSRPPLTPQRIHHLPSTPALRQPRPVRAQRVRAVRQAQ